VKHRKANLKIVDVVKEKGYEKYLYKCISPMPFRKYRKRREYLEKAVPRGFSKKILFFKEVAVGQIEYAPVEVSGYPILGEGIVVMHCIWVLRKAKGHGFGKRLLAVMRREHGDAEGFATVALENHWSPWLKKEHMEYLGFKPIASMKVTHRTKHRDEPFKIYLMWLPNKQKAEQPSWNQEQMLEGVHFCIAHPLYHPQNFGDKHILAKVE